MCPMDPAYEVVCAAGIEQSNDAAAHWPAANYDLYLADSSQVVARRDLLIIRLGVMDANLYLDWNPTHKGMEKWNGYTPGVMSLRGYYEH